MKTFYCHAFLWGGHCGFSGHCGRKKNNRQLGSFMQLQMMKIPKQDISNMELELYLGHLSAKAALFGWVQASWGQHKVWQRQIKLLYQPREAEAAGNPRGIIFSDFPRPLYLLIYYLCGLITGGKWMHKHLNWRKDLKIDFLLWVQCISVDLWGKT